MVIVSNVLGVLEDAEDRNVASVSVFVVCEEDDDEESKEEGAGAGG